MTYKEGTSKAGKDYKGWFCPNDTKEDKHNPVWVDTGVRRATGETPAFPAQVTFIAHLLNQVSDEFALLMAQKYDLDVGYKQDGETPEMFISSHHLTAGKDGTAEALTQELNAEKKKV